MGVATKCRPGASAAAETGGSPPRCLALVASPLVLHARHGSFTPQRPGGAPTAACLKSFIEYRVHLPIARLLDRHDTVVLPVSRSTGSQKGGIRQTHRPRRTRADGFRFLPASQPLRWAVSALLALSSRVPDGRPTPRHRAAHQRRDRRGRHAPAAELAPGRGRDHRAVAGKRRPPRRDRTDRRHHRTCGSTTPTATRPPRPPSRGRRCRKAPMSSWGRCARNPRPPSGSPSPIPASRS
jgi:hypothetical protein